MRVCEFKGYVRFEASEYMRFYEYVRVEGYVRFEGYGRFEGYVGLKRVLDV